MINKSLNNTNASPEIRCDRGILSELLGSVWVICATLGVRSLEEKPRRSRCFIAPATVCQYDVLDKPHKENAGDCDDPFAMLGGMAEQEVYKVTLMEEKSAEECASASEKKTAAEKVADVVEEEED